MASADSYRGKFRRALQIVLAQHFADAGMQMDFVAGMRNGPSTDRHLGCVWFDTKRPHPANANNEVCFFGARVLVQWKQDQGGEEPLTQQEERMEWVFEQLEDALVAVTNRVDLQTAANAASHDLDVDLSGWQDYFIVREITIDHQQMTVTATIEAQARSRTRKGG